MKIHNKPITIMTLIAFMVSYPSLSYAEDKVLPEGDYIEVKKGDEVPYGGYLFDAKGLISLMANKSLEMQQITIIKDAEVRKKEIEMQALKSQYELQILLTKELNSNILAIKDSRIAALEEERKWDTLKLVGALFLGIALSVTIFFAAVQISK